MSFVSGFGRPVLNGELVFIRIASRKPTGFSPWEECEQPNYP